MLPLLLLPLLWAGSRQQKIEIQLQVQEAVSVQEGLCALVPCSFSYPWSLWPEPPHISWLWNRHSVSYTPPVATNKPNTPVNPQTQGRFRLLGDPRTNCSLHIRDARRSDAGTYLVRVERRRRGSYYYGDERLALRVTDLTETPDIRFPEPLESGRPTNLTCSLPGACEGSRALTFSWSGAALNSSDPRTLHSSVLTLTPRPQDHGTNLTCRVQLQEAPGATERTVQLPVSCECPVGSGGRRGRSGPGVLSPEGTEGSPQTLPFLFYESSGKGHKPHLSPSAHPLLPASPGFLTTSFPLGNLTALQTWGRGLSWRASPCSWSARLTAAPC
ncbi:sialic acid-binding Ig-like lectin 14 isoform X2 [Choloepus didactylus]|uniref:sialic acid-binding Ig-like lectin 14 isoform X2 n=1 Tax=Choloepus didactylus TaxID=27675 RepID=UPI0018A0350C|nr:sialic acid-binding Ig-like lectin 14 isoform X2 [Choloepus didactylus]